MPGRIPTYAFHLHAWKRPVWRRFFPDRRFIPVPFHLGGDAFLRDWAPRIAVDRDAEIMVWSLNAPDAVFRFAAERGVRVTCVEDGFLRSVAGHAGRTPPLSLTLDGRTPYFDGRRASDLEVLLSTHDFDADPALLSRARDGIARIVGGGISKYAGAAPVDAAAVYGAKTRRRILVIGQVEDDASIRYGCIPPMTNNDLVRLAAAENPEAEILYKPHPDVLNRVRPALSDPDEVRGIARVLDMPLPLAAAFATIDHVYTITSLSGFEALMRGLPVTVAGRPFYAGWGLTDDRQPSERRGRRLTIEALFAGAYLLYPRYFDPDTLRPLTFEGALDWIDAARARSTTPSPFAARPGWRAFGPYGLLGWRHLLPAVVSPVIARLGTAEDVAYYRAYPIDFFREVPDRRQRRLGRLLYPFDPPSET
ncbi:capsular polysaccharide export protein, LipB/KpsS family [Ensifer soli]|uniref:capsular polysaccharide export protein, LipB/KpsS family n=1 Tax=Ciceribacter sp. sgz301302 TaxID=3342379 RepID=UPI0035B8788C